MRITILERVPSWNLFYEGQHHTTRTKLKNKWRMLVRAALNGDEQVFNVPVHITIIATYKVKPVDADNLCAKLLIDGLKEWVIHDDDTDHVHGVSLFSEKGEQDRVEIIVEEA